MMPKTIKIPRRFGGFWEFYRGAVGVIRFRAVGEVAWTVLDPGRAKQIEDAYFS